MKKPGLVRFQMRSTVYCGHESFLMYGADGEENLAFRSFMEALVLNKFKYNTRRTYAYAVSQLLDYLVVGFEVQGEITPQAATLLVREYYSYLVHGEDSNDSAVQKISIVKPRATVSPRSAALYHAAINRFIQSVRDHHAEEQVLESDNLKHDKKVDDFLALSLVPAAALLDNAGKWISRHNHGPYPNRKNSNSLLGHVPTLDFSDAPITKESFFPLHKIAALIESATSYRNSALWALLAATSIRVSEAMQFLLEDVDIQNRKVYARGPRSSARCSKSYRGIDEVSFNKLAWKGRTTEHTLLLEPYGSMFFKYYSLYLKHEYKPTYHNFIFQTGNGDPLCFSDYSSVVFEPFRQSSRRVLANTEFERFSYTPHSLRHSFCVFFKNFVEHTEGVGLRNSEIKALTGQKTDKAVERYAVMMRYLLELKIAFAFVRADDFSKSFNELKLGFLEREYDLTMNEVANEKAAA
ncbi:MULTISPECIES: tyrosine-type recombinase/integrase [Pseudomonas syringae group]|uniref:tyrosine-type recombinase/integrase n=1 Tax=Pseudomonas syringae group TaxID=136849 RepID=UPI0006E5EC4C|nr:MULTISPECIES: tyrosine-type recombinase/integrase [Pseudomonas syringae group]KPY73874.1 Phage integrase family site specific recombinase [Pseudomonas syringae pv. syringae]